MNWFPIAKNPMNWFPIAKIFLHALAPEKAHNLTVEALKRNWVPVAPVREYDSLSTTLWDMHFPNPIGLAAGFDKNAEVIDPVSRHGFGFIEVGSVTPLPQPGNEQPRLFRLPADRAVINRMGFNNHGADIFCANLESKTSRCIVGANIGKNKTSVDAIADYLSLLKRVYPVADYIVINISSPNTEGLRKLQEKKLLEELIQDLLQMRGALQAQYNIRKPIIIKIAPDNSPEQLHDIADLAVRYNIDGLIVNNTSVARPESLTSVNRFEKGGLSGAPIFTMSTQTLRSVYKMTGGSIPLIGCGGISSGADAYAKIKAGASLIQLYTALVYEGFGLVQKIKDDLAELLVGDGYANISEAVGVEAIS